MSPQFQLRKVTEGEGSSSPFMACIFMGLLGFRDQPYLLGVQGQHLKEMQDHFDHKFKPMFEAAQATRDAAAEAECLG